jgi:hypothetical protein
VCDPATVVPLLADRRAGLDDEDTTAGTNREVLAKYITGRKGTNADGLWLRLPAVREALKSASPHGGNAVSTCRWLAPINVPGIRRVKVNGGQRKWEWKGEGYVGESPDDWGSIPA